MRQLLAKDLEELAASLLQAAGVPRPDADLIGRFLVQVDIRGVFSHGTRQLEKYLPEFLSGQINRHPSIRVRRETPASTVIDGDGGAGYLAAARATSSAIGKAAAHGIALASSRYHGHVGSLGIYGRMVIDQGLIGFAVAGGSGWHAPRAPGATVWDAMGAPPMCFAIPAQQGPPLVLDMSVNFLKDRARFQEVFELCAPAIFASLGLRFVSTLLGGILAGTVPDAERDEKFSRANRGFLIVAFQPGIVGDPDRFMEEVPRIIAASRALKPIPGMPSAEVPGSREWTKERAPEALTIPEAQAVMLEELAEEHGIPPPWRVPS